MTPADKKGKQHLTTSGILSWALLILLALVIFFPAAKVILMKGLITIGLFRPTIPSHDTPAVVAGEVSAEFETVTGTFINTSDLKGKVVFINFWATWCPPCRAEMQGINELYRKMKVNKDVVFIMCDADGDLSSSALFMTKHQYDLPVFKSRIPPSQTIFSGQLPTTVVINKNGELVFQEQGLANYDTNEFAFFLNQLSAP